MSRAAISAAASTDVFRRDFTITSRVPSTATPMAPIRATMMKATKTLVTPRRSRSKLLIAV
nr:hypothetical protein [uncultured Rhodopila sp.]